jgi:predicted amidohydrolase
MVSYPMTWLAFALGATQLLQAAPNLVPNPEFRVQTEATPKGWQTWSPVAELRPAQDVVDVPGGKALRVVSHDFASFGKWLAAGIAVHPGHGYRFEVLFKAEGVSDETGSVGTMLSWYDIAGKPLQRDYVDRISPAQGSWQRAARVLRAPSRATTVTVELWLRWTHAGAVYFKDPCLDEVSVPSPRYVRVVTTRIQEQPKTTLEANLKLMGEVLDRAGRESPDIVLLTEIFVNRGVPGPPQAQAQPIPGPATALLSEKARQYKSYIVTTMLESDGGRTYNAAVLIDREGHLAGKYRKTHLPLAEVEDGITPGSEYPVFDTDFGRVGIMICWDAFFPETARILRLKGAEILFWPTAGDPGARHWDVTTRARAIDNGVYVVTSVSQGLASRIVDPDGEVVVETTDGLATANLDLAEESRQWWLSVGPADGEAKSLSVHERRPDTYGALVTDARPK